MEFSDQKRSGKFHFISCTVVDPHSHLLLCLLPGLGALELLPGVLRCSLLPAGTGTPGPHAGGATAGSPARAAPPVGHTQHVNDPCCPPLASQGFSAWKNGELNPRECREGQEQQSWDWEGDPWIVTVKSSLPDFSGVFL